MNDGTSSPLGATPRTAGAAVDVTETMRGGGRTCSGSGRLEVRCPSCHTPLEVAVDTSLTDLTCSSCGSHFSLVDQGHETRMAAPLSKLGRFELIERIGVGGFGTVWKARDKELDRTVAIKIPRHGGMTPADTEKFFREARAAAQLRHPSIVSVHEVGRDGDSVFIVSDFVRGVTLGDWLTGQRLTCLEAVELCAKVAEALEHAHEQGVIHRDLKPANIMIDGDGQPHLMDFGLARRDAGEVTLTMDGQVVGTPAYMSPEQAAGEGHAADRRSDVYSLGVVLFQLLTGELPFRGNARMLLHQVIHEEPPSPRKLNGNIPRDLETITLKCLEKNPDKRYATARDLREDLGRFERGEPILARPLGRIARGWRWCRRKPLVAGLSAGVAALLLLVGAAGPAIAFREAAFRREAERGELAALELKQAAEASEERARANAQLAREQEEAARTLAASEAGLRREAERAEQQRASAQQAAERTVYARTISLAQQEWLGANISQCEDLLDGTRSNLRGWEWEYLKHLCHADEITLRGLTSYADGVHFHKDGKHVVCTVSYEALLVVWDRETGRIVSRQPMKPYHVSGDGAVAVGAATGIGARAVGMLSHLIGGTGEIVTLWDTVTQEPIAKIKGPRGGLFTAELDFDGSRLLTCGRDFSIEIWDTKTRKRVRTFELPQEPEPAWVILSRDGRRVGWRTTDGWLMVNDADTGQELFKEREIGSAGAWNAIAFSPDGDLLVSTNGDQATIWRIADGKRVSVLHGHRGNVLGFDFSPTERTLATCGSDGTARIWDIDTGRELLCLRGHKGIEYGVMCVDFSEDGSRLATGGIDATVKIWDAHGGDPIVKTPDDADASADEGTAHPWLTSPDPRQDLDWLFGHTGEVMDFAYAPSGETIVSASADGTVKVWNLLEKKVERTFAGHMTPVSAVAISPDGETIASGGGGWNLLNRAEKILLWSRSSGEILHELEGHSSSITRLCFSADGKRLYSTSGINSQKKGEMFVWDVDQGTKVAEAEGLRDEVTGLDLSPDGQALATCGFDGQIRLWNTTTCAPLADVGQLGDPLTSVKFSPNGRWLAAGSSQNSVALYDRANGGVLWKRFEHAGQVRDVSFAGNGRLWSCSVDGSARLWDVESGDSLLVLRDYSANMYRARMSADGRSLVCAGAERRLSLRRLPAIVEDSEGDWKVLLADEFERSELGDQWKILNGTWTIDGGAACGTLGSETLSGEVVTTYAATISPTLDMPANVEVSFDCWSPNELSCEMKLSDEPQANSLIASYIARIGLANNRGERGYAIILQAGAHNFQELVSRRENFSLSRSDKHRMRVIRNQGRFRMFVDDTLVLEATAPAGLTVPELELHGVHGNRGDVVYFDNVVVRASESAN